MMNKKELAKSIIQLVGGENNVEGLEHCATRLRFTLRDYKKVESAKIEKLDGVMGVVNNSSQFQIIIGNQVHEVCEEIYSQMNIDIANNNQEKRKKEGNIFMRALAIIPRVFTPILPVLTAAGLLKALITILQMTGVDTTSSTYVIINLVSDVGFYFMPVFVAISASKVFKTSTYMAIMIAAMLLHPNWSALVSANEAISLFGLPVALVSYSSSMLPALLGVWILSYIEKFFNKYIPELLQFICTPLLTALVMMILMFVVIGPLGFYCGEVISSILMSIYDVAGWIAIVLIAAFKPLLVMTGMHYALTTAFITMFTSLGVDKFYLSASILSNLAQGGAAFGVFLRTKDKKLKTIALSTSFTAVMGITEPAMFGITLKYKRPFVAAMIGAAVGALYAAITGVEFIAMAGVGILGIIGVVPQFIVHMIIASIITFVISAILTVVFGFEEDVDSSTVIVNKQPSKTIGYLEKKEISKILVSPMSGKIMDVACVKDPAFSSEAIGKGVAIIPDEGRVYSPVDGLVSSLFQTSHAIGITSNSNEEILIHLGIDTVQLKGKYFHPLVKQGDIVKKGELLLEFDLNAIQLEGYDLTSPVVITNKNDYMDIFAINKNSHVKVQDEIIAIIDK